MIAEALQKINYQYKQYGFYKCSNTIKSRIIFIVSAYIVIILFCILAEDYDVAVGMTILWLVTMVLIIIRLIIGGYVNAIILKEDVLVIKKLFRNEKKYNLEDIFNIVFSYKIMTASENDILGLAGIRHFLYIKNINDKKTSYDTYNVALIKSSEIEYLILFIDFIKEGKNIDSIIEDRGKLGLELYNFDNKYKVTDDFWGKPEIDIGIKYLGGIALSVFIIISQCINLAKENYGYRSIAIGVMILGGILMIISMFKLIIYKKNK